MKNFIFKNIMNIIIGIYLILMFIDISDLGGNIFQNTFEIIKHFSFDDFYSGILTILSITFLLVYIAFILKIVSDKFFPNKIISKIPSNILVIFLFSNLFYFFILMDYTREETMMYYVIYTLILIISSFYNLLLEKFKILKTFRLIHKITIFSFIGYIIMLFLGKILFTLSIISSLLFYIFLLFGIISIIVFIIDKYKSKKSLGKQD